MNVAPPIPDNLWAKVPPDEQAAILTVVGPLKRRIADLEARLS
jgi:transposase